MQLFYFRNEIKYLVSKLKVLWDDKLQIGVRDDIVKIVKGTAAGTQVYATTVLVAAVIYMSQPIG